MQLKEELRTFDSEVSKHSANKTARAAILLLHRALRDKVFSVYSLAAQLIRIFFSEFATDRYCHIAYYLMMSENFISIGNYRVFVVLGCLQRKLREAWTGYFRNY